MFFSFFLLKMIKTEQNYYNFKIKMKMENEKLL